MGSLRKTQYYFLGFLTVYMITGIGALVLGNIWLNQSDSGAPREAVISRAIEQGKKKKDIPSLLPFILQYAFIKNRAQPTKAYTTQPIPMQTKKHASRERGQAAEKKVEKPGVI